MNIHPTAAAASIAGTERAANRGGESDARRAEARRQQEVAEAPAGKSADSNAIDSGQETSDRGGDGRQVLDTFEPSQPSSENDANDEDNPAPRQPISEGDQGQHLDLEA